jgi:sporulation protein YlmC with PRC-barrel domain
MQIDLRCSYSGIKNKKILDNEGKNVGRVIDAVFDDKLELTKLVIGGSRLEEWLEDRGLRQDIDPLVPIETITQVGEQITLSIDQSKLKTTLDVEGIAGNEKKFSQIMEYLILDANQKNIGKLGSFCINTDQSVEFIIYGDNLNPELSRLHAKAGLLYAFTKNEIRSVEADRVTLSKSLKDIERSVKHDIRYALIHASKMAWQDGKISEDELELLRQLEVNAEVYDNALKDALEDNIITQSEEEGLEKLKEDLVHKAYTVAFSDKVISKDEGAIIDRLANYMLEKREKLFWKTFGTYKDSR